MFNWRGGYRKNYIAFEYPVAQPEWWYEIVDGLPDPIMKRGFIDVWDRLVSVSRSRFRGYIASAGPGIVTASIEPRDLVSTLAH